ncbi:MAG: FtsW/RodA/SpoVE family cell cycle protein [Candidatus Dojkabacteria bacterium]
MNKAFKIDIPLFIASITIIAIGLFTLFSLMNAGGEGRNSIFATAFTNQLVFALIGILLSIAVFMISPVYLKFRFIIIAIYVGTIILLIATLIFGKDIEGIEGVRRWITIGSTTLEDGSVVGGITIQASEFTKFTMILVIAGILTLVHPGKDQGKISPQNKALYYIYQNRTLLVSIILSIFVIAMVYAQKSLSVTIVISLILFSVIFASLKHKYFLLSSIHIFLTSFIAAQGIIPVAWSLKIVLILSIPVVIGMYFFMKKKSLVVMCLICLAGIFSGVVIANLVWNNVLQDYMKERVETFFDPDRDAQNEGFQQEQAKISIGAGQFFGQGFREVSEYQVEQLPVPTTDFIFAIFGYKFGYLGTTILVLLYLVLIGRLFYLADVMQDRYSSLVLTGIGTMILVQFFFNIGMNLDLLPVGGTTLPLMSAGGSSLITTMVALAFAQSVIAHNHLEKNVYRRRDKVLINGWNV